MKNCSLVSVIVPVYNAEKHLSSCIESILNQSYKNIEIILINDGSIDKSEEICEEYAKKDYRVKVIHQENQGPSIARNRGINIAKGEYIQFVDSDDEIEINMTKQLVSAITNEVQFVICGIKVVNSSHITVNTPPIEGTFYKNDFLKYFGEFNSKNLTNSPCNKLYVKKIIKQFNMGFLANLNLGEDLVFNLEYINVCTNIAVIKDNLYQYKVSNNNNSLTKIYKRDLFENQKMLFNRIREFLLENGNYEDDGENKNLIEKAYTNSILGCLGNLFHKNNNSLTKKEKKREIYYIINDNELRGNISYFKVGNFQKRIIGQFIKFKAINGIYLFYKFKRYLRNIKLFLS